MSLLLYTCGRIALWILTPRTYFHRFDGARLHRDLQQLERAVTNPVVSNNHP